LYASRFAGYHPKMHLQVWLPAFLLVTQIRCAHNITVDNTDPSIIYWDALWSSDYNSTYYNGSLAFSNDNSAKVTLTFTGTQDLDVFVP